MAYVNVTKAFLEIPRALEVIEENGITLKNKRETNVSEVYQFDVEGDPIPDTDGEVEIWLSETKGELELDHIEVHNKQKTNGVH